MIQCCLRCEYIFLYIIYSGQIFPTIHVLNKTPGQMPVWICQMLPIGTILLGRKGSCKDEDNNAGSDFLKAADEQGF